MCTAADVEGVGGADDRADVEVVLPVLDGHVQRVPALVEIGDDGRHGPVAVAVDHVAGVAPREQVRVQAGVVRPRLGVRPDPGARASARSSSEGGSAGPDVPSRPAGVRGGRPLPQLGNPQTATVPFGLVLPMLLPPWLDPEYLIQAAGPYALPVVAFIIFAECGLFAILPGDSLLFTVGAVRGAGAIPYPLPVVCLVLTLRRHCRQRLRLLDRPADRTAAVPAPARAGRPDPEPEVRHQDPRVLREVRQPRADPGPLRAHRAHLRHPGGRRGQDGLPQVHRLHRHRRRPLGLRGDHSWLLPRQHPDRSEQHRGRADPDRVRLGHPDDRRVRAAPPPGQGRSWPLRPARPPPPRTPLFRESVSRVGEATSGPCHDREGARP